MLFNISFDYKIYSMSLPFLFDRSKLVREQLKIDVSTLPRSFDDYPRKVKELLSQKKLRAIYKDGTFYKGLRK